MVCTRKFFETLTPWQIVRCAKILQPSSNHGTYHKFNTPWLLLLQILTHAQHHDFKVVAQELQYSCAVFRCSRVVATCQGPLAYHATVEYPDGFVNPCERTLRLRLLLETCSDKTDIAHRCNMVAQTAEARTTPTKGNHPEHSPPPLLSGIAGKQSQVSVR